MGTHVLPLQGNLVYVATDPNLLSVRNVLSVRTKRRENVTADLAGEARIIQGICSVEFRVSLLLLPHQPDDTLSCLGCLQFCSQAVSLRQGTRLHPVIGIPYLEATLSEGSLFNL